MGEPVHHRFVRCAAILGASLLLAVGPVAVAQAVPTARVVASAHVLGPQGVGPVHFGTAKPQSCRAPEQPFREAKLAGRQYGLRSSL